MAYWWDDSPIERFWIEIRYEPGIGRSLVCPTADRDGRANAWYDLAAEVAVGDVVYHWNAVEHRFVGRSLVAEAPIERAGERSVRLKEFVPLRVDVDLTRLRELEQELVTIRDRLESRYPRRRLYLPFQHRRDGIRMMPNYFAKLPAEAATLLFDETGVAESAALPPPPSEGAPAQLGDGAARRGSFLRPFKPRADADYVARIASVVQRRSRRHERLVGEFARWLEDRGLDVGYNMAIDLAILNPPIVIEAKIIGSSWAPLVRQAVGQLYEYRYFQVVDPQAELVFLASAPPPIVWVDYLERDRGIGAAWPAPDGEFALSPLAASALEGDQS